MADKLVRWLNERGYQPVFMPVSTVRPPELYNFSPPHLRRLGSLNGYLPSGTQMPQNLTGRLADIQIVQTSKKSLNGAVRFLAGALAAIGITHGPAINLSFVGTGDFLFRLTDVTFE